MVDVPPSLRDWVRTDECTAMMEDLRIKTDVDSVDVGKMRHGGPG